MTANTYKWVGGRNTSGDANDATFAGNWDIESDGSFVTATTTPQSGDTALIDGGTVDILPSTPTFLTGIAFDFGGASATINLQNATLDSLTSLSAGAGDTGTVDIGSGVVNHATITAVGAGASIDLALSAFIDNDTVIAAETGGTVAVTSGGAGGTLGNYGGVVAFGGSIDIATPIVGFGLLVVASGTLTLGSSVGAAQAVVFGDNNAATLVVDNPNQFSARVLAFQSGDTIDLANIAFASRTLTLNGTVLTVTDGTHTGVLSFNGANFQSTASAQFSTSDDSSGGTLLTINNSAPIDNPQWLSSGVGSGGGSWSDAALWSTGTVPTAATTAQIDQLSGNAFTVTASGTNAVNTFVLLAPKAALDITGTLNATRAIFEAVGTIAEAAGAVLTAKTFTQLTGGASLTMAAGSAMTLSGGGAVPNNGVSGLDIEGNATLTGATLAANATNARIGLLGNGQLDVTAGSSVTASSTDLGEQGYASGQLVLDNSQWLDTPTDNTAPFPGYMIVGGGYADGAGGFQVGGSGTLTLQNSATLTDTVGAIIAQSAGSNGTVSITGGALWHVEGALTVGNAAAASADVSIFDGGTAEVASLLQVGGTIGVDPTSLLQVGTGTSGPADGLVIEPGGTYAIGGGASEGSTLDVLGSLVTSGATLSGTLIGSGDISIASNSTLTVNAVGSWTAGVNFAPGGGGGDYVLSGPASNDQGTIGGLGSVANTVDFPGISFDAAMPLTYDQASGVLTLGDSGQFLVGAHLALEAGLPLNYSKQQDQGTGTAIVLSTPCYATGTHIATPAGETPVEALRPGDIVVVLEAGCRMPRPVRWVGHFSVDLARHPAPDSACPIRIAAGAFADGMPHRDLRVSPDHAVLVDDVLMQAQALVNGATIRREPPVGSVTYVHVELDRHGILLAEGLPAESYLDTGNRGHFNAEAGIRPLFPDLAAPRSWSQDACAPLVLDGPLLAAAHARLLERAYALGHARSGDPTLVISADGIAVPSTAFGDGHFVAHLPAGTQTVQLRSRCFVPTAFDRAAGDGRRLGIAVASLLVDGNPLPASVYGCGWHTDETAWRWTDGDAELSLPNGTGVRTLDIRVVRAGPDYWATAA